MVDSDACSQVFHVKFDESACQKDQFVYHAVSSRESFDQVCRGQDVCHPGVHVFGIGWSAEFRAEGLRSMDVPNTHRLDPSFHESIENHGLNRQAFEETRVRCADSWACGHRTNVETWYLARSRLEVCTISRTFELAEDDNFNKFRSKIEST